MIKRLFTLVLLITSVINGQWVQQQKLNATDKNALDEFGTSVAIAGDYAIVGADNEGGNNNSGAAYIFVRSGTSWSQQAKLTSDDLAQGDYFAYSVDISGDYAVVSTRQKNDNSGAVYIFVRSGTSWSQQAKLTASDGDARMSYFGQSVSISGDYVIVGATDHQAASQSGGQEGAAYIFVRSGTSWSKQAKLTASDKAQDDKFGESVSIDGDYAIIGARQNDDAGNGSGSAYIFVRSGTSWSQQAKLTASDAAAGDAFGDAVSIDGDYAIVSAPENDDAGSNSGSAYIFVRSGTSWSQQVKLTASDATSYDYFGFGNVSISGDNALVGSFGSNDAGNDSGSAYVFTRNGTSWSQKSKLTASDAAAGDRFGEAVAIDGDYFIVGAQSDDAANGGNGMGSAYIYFNRNAPWRFWPSCTWSSCHRGHGCCFSQRVRTR